MKRKIMRYIMAFAILVIGSVSAYKYFDSQIGEGVMAEDTLSEPLSYFKTSPMTERLEKSRNYDLNSKEYNAEAMRKAHTKDKKVTLIFDGKKEKKVEYDLHEVPERKNPNFFLQEGEATTHGEYGTKENHFIGIYSEDSKDAEKLKEIQVHSDYFEHKYTVYDSIPFRLADYNVKFSDGKSANEIYANGEDELILQYGEHLLRAYRIKK